MLKYKIKSVSSQYITKTRNVSVGARMTRQPTFGEMGQTSIDEESNSMLLGKQQ